MSFDDPRKLDDELVRPRVRDPSASGRFIARHAQWRSRLPDAPVQGRWDGAILGLVLLAAFVGIGVVVLWVYR